MSWWKRFVEKARGAAGARTPGCDHREAIHLRQGTPEFEEFVARAELERGQDLAHGASHLANLLAFDPGRAAWVKLADDYRAAAPDPEALIPRGEQLYYATEALRAYFWQKQGRLEDAVDLLADVVIAKQDADYLEAWALDWLEPPGAVESLPEPVGLKLFATALNRHPEARLATLPRLRWVERWAALAGRFARNLPETGPFLMLRAGLLRKAGQFDDAASLARVAIVRDADWHATTALGLILREKGDAEGAEAAFRDAMTFEPDDVSCRLEAGDTFFRTGEWRRALDWYEDALAREPDSPWAVASAEYCRWKLTDDERHLEALTTLAAEENPRARAVLNACWGGVPEPSDATANVLRKVRESVLPNPAEVRGGEVKLTVSSLEAPSNMLAFRLEMEALGSEVRVLLNVQKVPRPDPREPIEPVRYTLWTYEGTEATPGLPPPAADVLRGIAGLAASPFDAEADWAAASRLAAEVGPARVGEVLAVMVHPPPVPKGSTALAWLPRVQHAAAQVAAQVDEGWEGSARREALLSVLFGPRDWATEAAIRALARLGVEHEALAHDVHKAFQRLADHRPDSGFCSWDVTLFQSWLRLPLLFPGERTTMERTLRKLQKDGSR